MKHQALLDQHLAALRALGRDNIWDAEDERLHPRGNPGNPGQFRKKDGPAAAPKRDSPSKAERPTVPPPAPQSLPKAPEGKKVKDLAKEQPDHPLIKAMADRGDLHPRDGGRFLTPREGTSYTEGDPRNDPEFEQVHNVKEALSTRYAGITREAIEKAKAKGKPASLIAKYEAAYKQRKKDRADGIGGETQELHDRRPDPVTGARTAYTPERNDLHEDILDGLEAKGASVPKQGKCIVMGGPSGAGKSTFLRLHGKALDPENFDDQGNPTGYITINPDDFKEMIVEAGGVDPERYPGLEPNELANVLHEESSDLAKRAVERLMGQGYNVILDITLSDAKKAKSKYLDKYDDTYSYRTVLVDGDLRNSLHNAGNRWKAPDKATGERTFGGRFIPMSLIEGQAPRTDATSSWGTQYRSSNAEAFEEFKDDPRVDEALVFDPFAEDPSTALRQIKGASRAATLRHRLSGMLRAEGRSDVKTTEITEKIMAFKEGRISEDALFQFLTEDVRYVDPDHPVLPGEQGRYQYLQDGGAEDTPGAFEEVTRARDRGLLTREFYARVNKTLYERGVPTD